MEQSESKTKDQNRFSVGDETMSQNYNNTISHFYRGEMQRTYNWRRRLDRTTNWAILIIAGTLTWIFSNTARLHFVLLLSIFFITFLAAIESRRYAVYIVYKSRLRVLEENFLALLLSKEEEARNRDWRQVLSEDLLEPTHKIGILEAFSRRLRRVYDWLFLGIIGAWISKLAIHPIPAKSLSQIIERARIGYIGGIYVFTMVAVFLVSITIISFYRWGTKYGIKDREAKGHLESKENREEDWREV